MEAVEAKNTFVNHVDVNLHGENVSKRPMTTTDAGQTIIDIHDMY